MSLDNLPFKRDGAVAALYVGHSRVLSAPSSQIVSDPHDAALVPTRNTGGRAAIDLGNVPGYGWTDGLAQLLG
jgi:hypothetical protein